MYNKVSLILTLRGDKSRMPKLWNTPTTARVYQSPRIRANAVAHTKLSDYVRIIYTYTYVYMYHLAEPHIMEGTRYQCL